MPKEEAPTPVEDEPITEERWHGIPIWRVRRDQRTFFSKGEAVTHLTNLELADEEASFGGGN